ncbi:MAG: helix-turn-helix domain-containing protein [Candidatus Omnitrophota bacterium]
MFPDQKKDNSFITLEQGKIYRLVIDQAEKDLIEKALQYSRGKQLPASKALGLNRNTLHSKIKKLNISIEKFKEKIAQ